MPSAGKLARESSPWVALAATERHLADLIEQRAGRVPGVDPIASLAMASKDAALKLEALEKGVHPKILNPRCSGRPRK